MVFSLSHKSPFPFFTRSLFSSCSCNVMVQVARCPLEKRTLHKNVLVANVCIYLGKYTTLNVYTVDAHNKRYNASLLPLTSRFILLIVLCLLLYSSLVFSALIVSFIVYYKRLDYFALLLFSMSTFSFEEGELANKWDILQLDE